MTDDRMICLTIVKSFRNVTRILAHGILFTHTHTHTDMTDDRMICLTIVRSFRDVTRILAHGILFHTHTHGHDKWQNDISDNYEKFQRCFTDTGSWFSFSHTHTRGHDRWQNMSDNCEKFQECYTHTSSRHFSFTQTRTWQMTEYIYLTVVRSFRDVTRILDHGMLFHTHTHTRTWLKTEWYIWQLWEVSEMLQWYTDTGSWHSSPRHTHTHTHGHDWCQNNISDNCEKFQRYYTDTGSWHSFPHTHTHTHRALIHGTHNTIMEKLYQWCCSWCIHTTSHDGWNLASTFPYRKKLFDDACHAVHLSVMRAWSLDFSGFLRT